jgi:serine/threonine protein kinase
MIMQRDLSERYLVPLFKNFIQIISSIHERGLIHRDLKLDNLMLVSADADAEIKLVDFGMMVRLPASGGVVDGQGGVEQEAEAVKVYHDRYLTGTPGYYAPESILRHEYSPQSDVWQCGVILFTILLGHLPFGSDNLKLITNPSKHHHLFAELETAAATSSSSSSSSVSVSPMAIDLLRRMLTVSPSERITLTEVLSHPWLDQPSSASALVFGSSYQKKLKNLACYETLKRAFHENQVEKESRSIRDGMSHVSFRVESIESQLLDLKRRVIKSLFQVPVMRSSSNSQPTLLPAVSEERGGEGDEEEDSISPVHTIDEADFNPPSPSPVDAAAVAAAPNIDTILHDLENASIDYETFRRLATESQLDLLTIPELFSLFDVDHNGSIDLREFLLTILTLRNPQTVTTALSSSSSALTASRDESDFSSSTNQLLSPSPQPTIPPLPPVPPKEPTPPARLYFELFDLDGSGSLSKNEFLWMLSCLFHDAGELEVNREQTSEGEEETTQVTSNHTIEELFQTLDLNQDNQIDYEEFQRFYQLMSAPSTQSSLPPPLPPLERRLPSHPKYNYLRGEGGGLGAEDSSFTFSSTGSSQLFSGIRSGVIHSSVLRETELSLTSRETAGGAAAVDAPACVVQ